MLPRRGLFTNGCDGLLCSFDELWLAGGEYGCLGGVTASIFTATVLCFIRERGDLEVRGPCTAECSCLEELLVELTYWQAGRQAVVEKNKKA